MTCTGLLQTKNKIGDTLYKVTVECTKISGRQKKFVKTDAQGFEWYRYDAPNFMYTVEEYTVVGIVQYTVQGTLIADSDQVATGEVEYHLSCKRKDYECVYNERYDVNFFNTKEKAEAHIKELEAKHAT